jgi:hypothetical protein
MTTVVLGVIHKISTWSSHRFPRPVVVRGQPVTETFACKAEDNMLAMTISVFWSKFL